MGLVMPWRMAMHIIKMVGMELYGWISSTIMVVDEIARALRARDFVGSSPVASSLPQLILPEWLIPGTSGTAHSLLTLNPGADEMEELDNNVAEVDLNESAITDHCAD